MISEHAFFDCCSLADVAHGSAVPTALCGAIAFGDDAGIASRHWLRAAKLAHLVGPHDPRFPRDGDVLDLIFDDAALLKHLKDGSTHWWPLCGTPRESGKPIVLHLNA